MVSVGLIVNSAASRDVRRLTSLARTVDVHERVNAVARILRGLSAASVDEILYMPEAAHVVERALDELKAATPGPSAVDHPPVRAVTLPGGEATDARGTAATAAAMARAGVACVVTIGGDGTNRAVVSGWPDAVLLPLPGGTNNAFAVPVDPTAAGIAAGLFAADPATFAHRAHPRPRIEVRVDGRDAAIALIDVALVREGWVGAHAIWDPAVLEEAVVARSDPSLTGLAGLGGMVAPLDPDPPRALHLRFGPGGSPILAPLGPGHLAAIGVLDWSIVGLDEPVELRGTGAAATRNGRTTGSPATIAFDGEREIVVWPGQRVEVRLSRRGPRVLDAAGLLRESAARGLVATPRGGLAPLEPQPEHARGGEEPQPAGA